MTEKQKLAKERSFVLKLNTKDIKNLLDICGYELFFATGTDGKPIYPIIRFYDSEKDEYFIQINCKLKNDLINKFSHRLKIFNQFVFNDYNPSQGLIIISDYNFTDVFFNDVFDQQNSENQIKYARFMYKKFGEYYKTKYNQSVRKFNKQIKQQQQK